MSEDRVMGPTVDEFLKECEQSGDATYGAFRSVLAHLEDPTSGVEAWIFLSELQKRFSGDSASADHCFHTYHFRIDNIFLDQYQGIVKKEVPGKEEIDNDGDPKHICSRYKDEISKKHQKMKKPLKASTSQKWQWKSIHSHCPTSKLSNRLVLEDRVLVSIQSFIESKGPVFMNKYAWDHHRCQFLPSLKPYTQNRAILDDVVVVP